MRKPYWPAPGTAPASLQGRTDRPVTAPQLRLTEYGPHHFEEKQVASVAELPEPGHDGLMRWIEMDGLGDPEALRALGLKYDLHPLALEDTLHTGQRPKFEPYEGHLFVVAQMVYDRPDKQHCHEQVSIFICRNLLITIQEEPEFDVFDPVRARLRDARGAMRKRKSDYLAYALIDAIIDHVFPVLERIGNEIEEMEDDLIDRPSRDSALRIHTLKRSLMILRRAAWPERDVVNAMMHDESGLITKETKVFLRDCYDHTVQAMDLIESYRDVASGMMEIYLSAVGMRTNEIMRVLTVISAIFIPLTFVAGVYGMNFDNADGKMPLNMPELHWPFGYLLCLAFMALVAIGEIIFFKKKGWW